MQKIQFLSQFLYNPSSETQGQVKGARESLNGRKNMARRKVKNGEKSPWGQCLTRPVPTVAAVLASDCCQKTCVFLAPIRSQNGGDRWNWSGKTLSPGALLAVLYFSSSHIFPPVQTFPRPFYLPLGLRGWEVTRTVLVYVIVYMYYGDQYYQR